MYLICLSDHLSNNKYTIEIYTVYFTNMSSGTGTMMTNAVPVGAQTSLLAQAHQLAVPNSMGGNQAMFQVPIKGGYVPMMHIPIMKPRIKKIKAKKVGGGSRKSRKGGKSKKSRNGGKSKKSKR